MAAVRNARAGIIGAGIFAAALAAAGRLEREPAAPPPTPKPPAKSPHVQIVARGEVMTKPRRMTRHGRVYLEFAVTLSAYNLAPDQLADADRKVEIDMQGPVTVVHDVACGGEEPALAVGDRVELSGEYVKAAPGDRIEFTHGTGASRACGKGSGRPEGYLREVVPAAPTAVVTPPRPSDIVPDQPFVGTPAAGQKPYAEILRMKTAGATDEELLERIAAEKKRYALTTGDLQALRAAGVSTRVIEAMLRSGHGAVTPSPTPSP